MVKGIEGFDYQKNIRKIIKVIQRGGKSRFDIDVLKGQEQYVLEVLRKERDKTGWHVQCHVPWRMRHMNKEYGSPKKKGRIERKRPEARIVSWNVSSANNKRELLGYAMRKEKTDIVLMQETRRGVTQWRMRFEGYQCLESLARDDQASNGAARVDGEAPGRHGMLVAVRNRINAYEVGDVSGYWMFVRVSGGPLLQACIIGNLYRPHAGLQEVRKMVTEGVKKQLDSLHKRFPHDAIVLMGDFNEKGTVRDKSVPHGALEWFEWLQKESHQHTEEGGVEILITW